MPKSRTTENTPSATVTPLTEFRLGWPTAFPPVSASKSRNSKSYVPSAGDPEACRLPWYEKTPLKVGGPGGPPVAVAVAVAVTVGVIPGVGVALGIGVFVNVTVAVIVEVGVAGGAVGEAVGVGPPPPQKVPPVTVVPGEYGLGAG